MHKRLRYPTSHLRDIYFLSTVGKDVSAKRLMVGFLRKAGIFRGMPATPYCIRLVYKCSMVEVKCIDGNVKLVEELALRLKNTSLQILH